MASPSTSQNNIQSDGPFPELLVIQAFHIFTINSLSQVGGVKAPEDRTDSYAP